MCLWLPQTPELHWPVHQGLDKGLLKMSEGLNLGIGEEEVGVELESNTTKVFNSAEATRVWSTTVWVISP